MKPKADPTDTYASPPAIARTPEELLESMTGMFLPPSAMGEVNGLKILCLQRENARLQMELEAEVERLRGQLTRAVSIAGVLLADIEDFHGNAADEEWTSSGWNDSRIGKALLEQLREEIK